MFATFFVTSLGGLVSHLVLRWQAWFQRRVAVPKQTETVAGYSALGLVRQVATSSTVNATPQLSPGTCTRKTCQT